MNRFSSVLIFALIVVSGAFTHAQSIITTIAGNGVTQYIGDGFPATSLSLAEPRGICMDANRNLIIADKMNMRIRLLKPNDSIFTISGDGTAAYSGDHGPFSGAHYNRPVDVRFDPSGNLYIADFENYAIRKVDASTHEITTICGDGISGFGGDGAAASLARLGPPKSLAVDRTGNIFVMDGENHRVRELKTDGTIITVAGNGTIGYSGDGHAATNAQLAYATGVCTDVDGNIYIADKGNNVVRKVDKETGVITTVAGMGTLGYSGNGGLAVNAELSAPNAVYVDRHNNLFICDDGNNVLRGVDSRGIIYAVAGSGAFGYTGDGGPATDATFSNLSGVFVDDSDYIYVLDMGNSAVRKITPAHLGVATVDANFTGRTYPNPVKDVLFIELDDFYTEVNWLLTDIAGQTVFSGTFNGKKTMLEMSGIANGIYILKVESKGGVLFKKIIVDR